MTADERELKDLAGIGPSMLRDLNLLGIYTVKAVQRRKPERMYRDLLIPEPMQEEPCAKSVRFGSGGNKRPGGRCRFLSKSL